MKNDNNYCTIYIARHGETEWNLKKLIQGHTDSPLTKNGSKQAEGLANELSHIDFSAIYASDLLRAKRTADIVAQERKLAVETTKALRERNHGVLEGKPREELKKLGFLLKKTDTQGLKKLGIEDDEKLIGRVITFLREIAIAFPSKTILIISHGGTIRTLLTHLGFYSEDNIPDFPIGNTAYIKLKSDGIDFFVEETKRIKIPN